MKKTLALLLALVMILGLAACGQSAAPAAATPAPAAEPAPAEAAPEAKTYKVGVAIYQFDDNFMTLYRNELQDYFKSLETDDVKYDVTIVDGKNDMAEQNNQIDNFITQGMDAIILNLVQTSSADAAIEKIVAAGIPCILINREPLGDKGDESYEGILNNAKVCYVGADARQSGTYQGEIIAELANHGDINGDGKVSYIMIEGDPENIDAQYRTEFSVKALKDAGIEVEELDDQIGNWAQAKGQEICSNDLAKFGNKVEVVFCNNDAMALGAATAITAAGRTVGKDIYLVGVDALEECQQMVKEGTMTGTVLNDHIGQSHKAVDVTVQALKGEPIDNYYWVDYVKVVNDEAPAAEAAPAASGTYKVGVAIYQFDDNFMTLYRNELLDYFKSLETDDLKFDVTIVDGKNDMAEQNNQIDNFITQGMDAIILNLVQTSSADAAIDKIVEAGIPCILINREPLGDKGDESYEGILNNATVCYVGADARQSGTYQGEIIAELPNHGDINGDGKVSYIMIEGDPENIDAQYRTEFSVKALKDAGIEVEELDDQIGNWAQAKGQEICSNDLAKFGDKVEVVFCNNDAMALGAATAITAAGRTVGKDIYLVGVDALEECQQMVKEGTMTGTVLNDHIGQSHAAVDVTVKALKGEPIDNYYWVDYVKVVNDEAPAAEAAPAAAAPTGTYKVGVAIYQFDDNFMTLYRNELLDYFKSLETDDLKFDVTIVDGKNDMAEQNNQIDNFITQGMDAIILNLVQTSSADAAIDKIVEAGIPCILINREPLGDKGDESYEGILNNATVCYVGADARQSGTYQGEIIAELPNHGDINGDGKVSYIMIEGDPENIDAQYRTEFSVKALKDAGIEVEELDDQIGNWAQAKGQEICSNDLAKFGDKVEVVFCNNDAMALGAATAITAAGRTVGKDIYLVGVDALEECQQMVKEGTMTGTVLNDHIGQSHKAVDVTVQALTGEPIDNYYWVDYVKVTA